MELTKDLKDYLGTPLSLADMVAGIDSNQFEPFARDVRQAAQDGCLLDFSVELSRDLENMNIYKANVIARLIGAICEKEENTSAGKGVVDLFVQSCGRVYDLYKHLQSQGINELPEDLDDLYTHHKDWLEAYFSFNSICLATMAFATRDGALRDLLRTEELFAKISFLDEGEQSGEEGDEDFVPCGDPLRSLFYVGRLQKTCSHQKILVLQPDNQQGFYAEVNDLDNCFHLIFLLEEQIARNLGGKYGIPEFEAQEEMIRMAHGEYIENCPNRHYQIHFSLYNYRGMRNGEPLSCIIWGEMPPEAIPAINDYAIIILGNEGMRRSFDMGFVSVCHTALTPFVEIERELTKDEYERWMDRIAAANK